MPQKRRPKTPTPEHRAPTQQQIPNHSLLLVSFGFAQQAPCCIHEERKCLNRCETFAVFLVDLCRYLHAMVADEVVNHFQLVEKGFFVALLFMSRSPSILLVPSFESLSLIAISCLSSCRSTYFLQTRSRSP